MRVLQEGETVWARNYHAPDKWVKAKVIKADGSRRYSVATEGGQILKCHEVRRRSRLSDIACPVTTEGQLVKDKEIAQEGGQKELSIGGDGVEVGKGNIKVDDVESEDNAFTSCPNSPTSIQDERSPTPAAESPAPRFPKRTRRPVVRFEFNSNIQK